MNTQGVLGGHKTTESFVNELQKHMKVTKVCDNDHISDCFDNELYTNTYVESRNTIDTSKFKLSSDMANEDWGTNVMGIQFINGVTALLAYNPTCNPDPYNANFDATSCVGMIYDVNGNSNPNFVNQDVRQTANTKSLSVVEINGVQITNIFITPATLTTAQCEQEKNALGIKECPAMPSGLPYDYWASAVKMCGGVDKMASAEDLAKIATAIYGTNIGANESKSGLTFNETLADSIGLKKAYVYTNENSSGTLYASERSLLATSTSFHRNAYANRCNQAWAICVSK